MKLIITAFLSLFSGALMTMRVDAASAPVATSKAGGRSANTCADPSLATTWMVVFDPAQITHALGPRGYTIGGITVEGATKWQFQGNAFVAWSTEQEFTVPLYRLDKGDQDYRYSTSPTPPAGWTLGIVIGYVYETQVCGSVPLLGAWNQAAGDHYYTIEANEHSELIATAGWTDAGIAGYVLPLGSI